MTINETQDRIVEEFSQFNDWLDRYEHLIFLGNNHPSIDSEFKNDRYALPGCQSQVWIRTERVGDRVHIQADSDSIIIKGILSLLVRTLNGQKPTDVAMADLYFIKKIGLSTNLSPSRANGLRAILNRLQQWRPG